MGDRANIVVKHEEKSFVHIYVHSAGYALPALLHKALTENPGDWGDPAYLTAKIAQALMGELSSVGIASVAQDNDRKVLLVDPFMRRDVTVWASGRYEEWDTNPPDDDAKPLHRWTFQEFVNRSPEWLVKTIHGVTL